MTNASYISISQQNVLRRQMDAIAQNLANMNTPAFKSERILFEEYLFTGDNGEPISYVQEAGLERNMDSGPIETTGNDLDVALKGSGWLVVQTDQGPRYTRHGHFQLDSTRTLVTPSGDPVLSTDGKPIQLGKNDAKVTIGHDGTVSAGNRTLGRLAAVSFESDKDLIKIGTGLFAAPDDMPPTELSAEQVSLEQGALEMSNVQPILEMTRMIDVLRSYQMTQQLTQTDHDLELQAIQEITAMN